MTTHVATPLLARVKRCVRGPIKAVLGAVLAVTLASCSLWNEPRLFAVTGQSLDLGTTAYAVCVKNYVEANSILAGDGCEETMAISLLLKGSLFAIFHYTCAKNGRECPNAFRAIGMVGFVTGGVNLYTIGDN